ncbi:DUF559 domain-containing protein [Gordonia sp. CPCC 206044]|uniref:endonuclease domain-containing protein n=1 Tax=Gordonia sp. CPCC 206044 TaxID=3140793 RepID=UPI003AF34B9E
MSRDPAPDKRILRRQEALERSNMTAEQFTAAFSHLHGGLYVDRSVTLSPTERIRTAAQDGPSGSVVGLMAATILHGSRWYDADFTIDLVRGPEAGNRKVRGRRVRRTDLQPDDVTEIDGIPVTNAIRTAFDIGRIAPDWYALGLLDSLFRATGFCRDELAQYARRYPGHRGVRQLRNLIPLIDDLAESPPESWVRLIVVKADLPLPRLQVEVADDTGHVFARIDLAYEELKIAIEYDGEEFHSTEEQRARDAARDAKLRAMGWIVIRLDKERLRTAPWSIVIEIEKALRSRGGYF